MPKRRRQVATLTHDPDPTPPASQPFWIPLLVLLIGGGLIIWFTASAIGKGHEEELAKQLAETPTDNVSANDDLLRFAVARGAKVYAAYCANCHGMDRKGVAAQQTPDLTDTHWLHGGDDIDTFKMHPSDIEKTVLYGIHANHEKTRDFADMPPYGEAGRAGLPEEELADLAEEGRPLLTSEEIGDLTELVLQVSGRPADDARAERGKQLYFYKAGCFDCHTYDFKGDTATGTPDLTQPQYWLFGSDRDSIYRSIEMGHRAVSPAFEGKLSPEDIKAVALYVLPRIEE